MEQEDFRSPLTPSPDEKQPDPVEPDAQDDAPDESDEHTAKKKAPKKK